MAKTVTIRLEDPIFNIFKLAADGEKRSISNFIAWATLGYLVNEFFVSDEEMAEIMKFSKSIRRGLADYKKGKYHLVKA